MRFNENFSWTSKYKTIKWLKCDYILSRCWANKNRIEKLRKWKCKKYISCALGLKYLIISKHISISKQSRPWWVSSYTCYVVWICSICKVLKGISVRQRANNYLNTCYRDFCKMQNITPVQNCTGFTFSVTRPHHTFVEIDHEIISTVILLLHQDT